MTPSPDQPSVIFYRYEESPFAHKIDLLLAIRKIPHLTVLVSSIPPRPELLILGIPYRRIPVLAIGDTVYCDTFQIAEAIEALFPPDSEDHPSLFPKNPVTGVQNAALQKLLAQFWTDRVLFKLAAGLLPWKKMPKKFVEDRATLRGFDVDVNQIEKLKPYTISQLQVHLALVEQQLQESSTGFFLGTTYPSFLDVSVFFGLKWIQEIGAGKELFGDNDDQKYQSIRKWMKLVAGFYEANKSSSVTRVVSAEEANSKIPKPNMESGLKAVTVDEKLFGLGTQVDVVPDDYGNIATSGKLVEINEKSVVVIVKRGDDTDRGCRVCFPRLGFNVLPASENQKL